MRYLTKKDLSILLGNALDNFDTSIYSFLAPLLAPLFFPHYDPIVQLILAYSVLMSSFFARPLGAFIFGVIARKHGPIYGLSYSLIGVAVGTVLTGFLPSHEAIGWFAPLGLVGLRMVKGIFAAGESTIAKLYLMEDKPDHHALKVSHLYQSSSMLGTILASGAATLVIAFQPDAWRLCFWLGGITGFLGYFLRRYSVVSTSLQTFHHPMGGEIGNDLKYPSPALRATSPTTGEVKSYHIGDAYSVEKKEKSFGVRIPLPLWERSRIREANERVRGKKQYSPSGAFESYHLSNLKSLWVNRSNILRVALGTGFGHLTYSIPFVFMNSFIPLITSISLETMMVLNTVLLVFDMVMIPLIGRFLIPFDGIKVMLTASLILTITIIPLFNYLPHASLEYVIFVRFWIVFWGVVFLCPLNFWFKSLFKTSEQYLLVGMGTALGASTIGRSTTPLCLWLWYVSDLSTLPALYVGFLMLVTAYGVQSGRKSMILNRAQRHNRCVY